MVLIPIKCKTFTSVKTQALRSEVLPSVCGVCSTLDISTQFWSFLSYASLSSERQLRMWINKLQSCLLNGSWRSIVPERRSLCYWVKHITEQRGCCDARHWLTDSANVRWMPALCETLFKALGIPGWTKEYSSFYGAYNLFTQNRQVK